MLAKYCVGAQGAATVSARHSLCPKTTLYSADINKSKSRERMVDEITDLLKVWWNRKEVQQILSLAERSCAE